MSADPMSNSERARRYRERQRAKTPPDVLALLEHGREAKLALAERARAEMRLVQVRSSVARRLHTIDLTISPSARARMLGELADWLQDEQHRQLFDSLATAKRMPKATAGVMIPRWVPADMVDAWKAEWKMRGELAAASKIRAMKRARVMQAVE